jgi:NADP-dependent 3-hydroxy acid dehydrogenase YdfG
MIRCFGGVIDTLILCHGVVVEKGLITCTIPAFDQTMLVNVRSMMHLVSLAVPFLKVQDKSSITILTSSQGTKPDPKAPVMSIAASMV